MRVQACVCLCVRLHVCVTYPMTIVYPCTCELCRKPLLSSQTAGPWQSENSCSSLSLYLIDITQPYTEHIRIFIEPVSYNIYDQVALWE